MSISHNGIHVKQSGCPFVFCLSKLIEPGPFDSSEEDQGETDGIDPEEPDRHPLGRHCGKCEPQPARLGELLSLSELKSGDEQNQESRGRPVANALDEAP